MAKRLIVARSAYLHLDRVIEFNDTRNKSSTYSKRIVKELFAKFRSLAKFPYRGKQVGIAGERVMIWDQFYIYYFVTNE